MYIDKAVILTCVMFLLACAFFFFLGYNMAYTKAVVYSNEIIQANREKFEFYNNPSGLVYEPINLTGLEWGEPDG